MSDNIPFEIQMEIIKKVPDVKSLIRFRSVSKPWKSFIDSYKFIHHTDPHRLILRYKDSLDSFKEKFICFVDYKNDALTHQQEFDPTVVVLIKELNESRVVGSCHGVFCVYGVNNGRNMVVLWNPSIRKCVGMVVPHVPDNKHADFGFGVCPVTNDPMIVKIPCMYETSRQVEVFTLSSGVWSVIPSSKMFRESLVIMSETHVVIDRFIYWIACESNVVVDDGALHYNYKILLFDMIAKEFKVVDVPYSLTKQFYYAPITISKLRESLVLLGFFVGNVELDELVGGVWIMEHDGGITSFRKLFTCDIPDSESINEIRGYRNTGEPIIEITRKRGEPATLEVYSPVSKHINILGIYGEYDSFFMGSYMETLLLLDHADCFIYDYILRSDLLPHEGEAKLVISQPATLQVEKE